MKTSIILIAFLAGISFVMFVPVQQISAPNSYACDKGNCQNFTQYGSILYVYGCFGSIYDTTGRYWITECMYE